VRVVQLNRPADLNGVNRAMHGSLARIWDHLSSDTGARVVVITGVGSAFSAGGDFGYMQENIDDEAMRRQTIEEGRSIIRGMVRCPLPVIAAVNGAAAGVGFALACYCDLRFAAAGAKLTTAHGRLGLPAEFGLSWLLPRLVGLTRAADVLLSSRVLLAEEAAEMGLVNRVTPAEELLGVVHGYARVLATEVSPASLAATKLQLYADLHRDAATAARDAEERLRSMMAGPDFAEGVAALAARRPPHFADPGGPAPPSAAAE